MPFPHSLHTLDLPSLNPKLSVLGNCYYRVTFLAPHFSLSLGSQGQHAGRLGSAGFVGTGQLGTYRYLLSALNARSSELVVMLWLVVMLRGIQPP